MRRAPCPRAGACRGRAPSGPRRPPGCLARRGPLAKEPSEPADRAKPDKSGSYAGAAFRLLSIADGAFDLDRALGTSKQAGARALLGGVLDLAEDLDGWLLLSADGPISVCVDGKPVWSRDSAHLRGAAWDAAPLSLTKGRHTLVLRAKHPGQWWAIELRVLDARDLAAPRGMRWRLPGTSDAEARKLAHDMLSASLHTGLAADGYHPRLALDYRRGAPDGARPSACASERTCRQASFDLAPVGDMARSRGASCPWRSRSPSRRNSGRTPLDVDVQLGGIDAHLKSGLDATLPGLVARAEAAATGVEQGKPSVPTARPWPKACATWRRRWAKSRSALAPRSSTISRSSTKGATRCEARAS